MTSHWRRSILPLALIILIPIGCRHENKPRPLTPAAFTAPPRNEKDVPIDPLSPADQAGAIYNNARGNPPAGGRRDASGQQVDGLSPIVQESVRAPGVRAEDLSSPATQTSPATRGATSVPTGGYLTLGGVVMVVDGTPIYANKVLNLLDPVFAARAKELDERQFRALAIQAIGKQMAELRDLQLEYAAAERHLDQKDKEMADGLTMQWRQDQVRAAGGSLAVARDRAAARGDNFDDLVQQQYRTWMSRIYYQKKIMPRVQVSANEIRAYYDHNKGREFTDPGVARFRLIKINPAKHGGRDEALRLITELRNRITKAGEPFEGIARSVNDDPRWLKSGGDLGTAIQQGAFAIGPVEQAVWQTPVGQVTSVIDAGPALYIALVEEKKPATVHGFDDEAVQTKIDYTLRTMQFSDLRQKVRENLLKDAVVRSDPDMMNIALEMAMQNYSKWAGK